MENCISFKSDNNNHYFLNQSKRILLPLHPDTYEIINYYLQDKIIDWEDIRYLKQKNFFDFLIKYELLDKRNIESTPNTVSINDVSNSLTNISDVTIELTENCNLNCYYCTHGSLYSDKPRIKGDISFENIRILFDFLKNEGAFSSLQIKLINIGFYGGEPLVAFDIIKKIVQYIKGNYENETIKFRFGFTTNGILLKKNIDFLVQNNFHISVSLDGNEIHNQYRVDFNNKNSFKLVEENLLWIRNEYPEFYEKINILTVLHNKNPRNEVDDYMKNTLNKNPKYLSITTIDANNAKQQEIKEIAKNQYEKIAKKKFIDRDTIVELLTNMNNNYFRNYEILINKNEKTGKVKVSTGTCTPFSKRLYLTVGGKIYPCERVSENDYIGEITNSQIKLNLSTISNFYNDIYSSLWKSHCRNCYNIISCKKCIFYLEGRNTINKPECREFLSKTAFVKKMSNHLTLLENSNSNKVYSNRFVKNAIIL